MGLKKAFCLSNPLDDCPLILLQRLLSGLCMVCGVLACTCRALHFLWAGAVLVGELSASTWPKLDVARLVVCVGKWESVPVCAGQSVCCGRMSRNSTVTAAPVPLEAPGGRGPLSISRGGDTPHPASSAFSGSARP
jgi:hypothetical protein